MPAFSMVKFPHTSHTDYLLTTYNPTQQYCVILGCYSEGVEEGGMNMVRHRK